MSRRGKTYQRKPGRGKPWSFVVDVGPEGGPRQQMRRHGFRTQKEAQQAINGVLSALQDGTFVQPNDITVGDFLREWKKGLPLTRKPSTVESYDRYIDNHVLSRPALERTKLQKLSPMQLDAVYTEMLTNGNGRGGRGAGLKPRTVRYFHTIIHAALDDAQRLGLVVRNVADAVTRLPSADAGKPPEFEIWDHEELAAFLDHVMETDDDDEPFYTTAAGTGLRRAEMYGMRWADIIDSDGDEPYIWVRKTLQVLKGGKVVYGDTKSKSGRRKVHVDETVVAALRRQKKKQAAWKLALGGGWSATFDAFDEHGKPVVVPNDLVFTNPDGTHLSPVAIPVKFQRRARAAGLNVIRFHDLRHTHATHLLMAGADPKYVSERLGHSSVSFTLDRYGHVLPRTGAKMAKAVGESIAVLRKVSSPPRRKKGDQR